MPWWTIVLAAVALVALTYVLAPRPKAPKPESVTELEEPTADAGRPVTVPFGTITIKQLNELWYGDKQSRTGTT